MGIVMIVCPKMGKAISTGTHIDRAAFGSMPVFSVARFVRRAAPRTSGLPRAHGFAIAAPRTVTRIARGGPRSARPSCRGIAPLLRAPRAVKLLVLHGPLSGESHHATGLPHGRLSGILAPSTGPLPWCTKMHDDNPNPR
jgi:hypothetical protein